VIRPIRRPVYEAGPWAVDLALRELRTNGIPVPIGGRAFEIIEVLVQSAGDVVTKDDLMALVWSGDTVEETTLQVQISGIRKAFGPDRGMLKTEFGRGYRLLGNWTIQRENLPADTSDLEPVPRPAEALPTNLPVSGSELIGRDAAARQVRDLLSAHRVVTLTGPGGIGKTALALDVARGLSPGFPGGTWLVELASLSDAGLVPSAVASVLGLEIGADEISPASVARTIGGRTILLVLDNCEHVIETAARLVEAVVRMCPHASILTTSRELLRIDGEHDYRVQSLDVPPQQPLEPDDALRHSAVQLFIARMQALDLDISAHRDELSAIGAICRHLDGIPLAIEFAAARAATLGIEQVLFGLGDRFALLTSGRRTALPRHRTLRATLDWSYDLLPEAERQLLRRLAVFVAGFTPAAASAVMGNTGTSVVEGIANLVARSLVTLDDKAPATRWRMLETIRAYALEKLAESGEFEVAARRHAEFFRDLFAPSAPVLKLQSTSKGMASYVPELDNVRMALDWSFSRGGDAAIGVALTAAYVPVWLYLSLSAECTVRAESALDRIESEPDLSERRRMQLYVELGSALLQSSGIVERARGVLAKALERAEAQDDNESQLRTLWAMWSYLFNKGEHREALPVAERFARVTHHSGDPADVLVGDRFIGVTMHYSGNQTEARRRFERVLAHYVVPSDPRHTLWFQHDQRAVTRAMLARVLCLQGLVNQAIDHANASLEDARASDHVLSLRYTLSWASGPVALMAGDLVAAERSVAMLKDIATRYQLPFWKNWARGLEGTLFVRRGEFATGSALLRAALGASSVTRYLVRDSEFLGVLAEGLAGLGQFPEALATVNEALERSDRTGEGWCVAELCRIKGELLLHVATGQSISEAEACFREALTVAHQQGALFWELRAAMGLARLKVQQGQPRGAQCLLAPVYDRFTEGFETADLRSARMLLDTLT
jgi:predicted ATPase/DNA-binding winged helix-turn-helix (wHTH) protein